MELVSSTETCEQIEKLAGAGWSVGQIARYFDVPEDLLMDFYHDRDSWFRHHYERGVLKSQAERDIALSDSAAAGSVTAVQMIDKRMKERDMENFKERLLNGS